ncbi:hypothetical protein KBZ10_22935 [Streptomyces sp. F63]|uniref:hypothetical protein n=1 Tax=Streptomyces sp. F63 TaxID=2824887 RepID=UPI001B38ECE0|nr:hypothetical protein [Streptomyces sp. F63]MBQ0987321.1 hypothetical protein [Streptomyces sp. F63]
MEPRQWWERNTVLAEAFCRSDEQVRSAQAILDEAQVHRSRLLAAFAVTVGSDGAVAGVLGLNEREVRVARRTVGKEDARGVADELLTAAMMPDEARLPPEGVPAPEAVAAPPAGAAAVQGAPGMAGTAAPAGVTGPGYEAVGPAPEVYADPTAYQHYAHAHPQYRHQQPNHSYHQENQTQPPPQSQTHAYPQQSYPQQQPYREPRWTGAMDALLVGSWQTGVDLQVLAAEFGLDLARLVSRAQQLSAEGRLSPPWAGTGPGGEPRSGRHRRSSTDLDDAYDFYDAYGHPVHPGAWEVPSTVPDDMVASVGQQSGVPHYTHGAVA